MKYSHGMKKTGSTPKTTSSRTKTSPRPLPTTNARPSAPGVRNKTKKKSGGY